MTLGQGAFLFAAALVGGAQNAVAGGGSFLTFPALIVSGVSSIHANATSTVALWPGSLASAGAYRKELRSVPHLGALAVISLICGWLGALLLLRTPAATFSRLIPVLLLAATLLFAFGPSFTAWMKRRAASRKDAETAEAAGSRGGLIGMFAGQAVISIYGGYFGGGIGILMLAAFGLMGMENIHEMNALKTVLASCINGIAVITFVIAGAVNWPQALVMLVGAVIGGYAGAAYARKLDPALVRRLVIVIACLMTVYFFVREF
ncbi:MAG TPA: sulfite exporter TauE/SafE family protein [Chloroflexota bacterium]